MNHFRRTSLYVAVTMVAISAFLLCLTGTSAASCTVYYCMEEHAYALPPGYEDDDTWICENATELCEEYEVPDCPGCKYKVCYVSYGWREKVYHCASGTIVPTCDDGNPAPWVNYINNGSGAGPYRNERDDVLGGMMGRRGIICSAPVVCAVCQVPQDFLDFLDEQKESWEESGDALGDGVVFWCSQDGKCGTENPLL